MDYSEETEYSPVDYSNYRFLVKPVEFLEILAPSNTKWGLKLTGLDEEGKPVYEGKTLDEFLTHKVYSLDGSTVAFMLCAKPEVTRPRGESVSTRDIDDWIGFLANLGLSTNGEWDDVTESEIIDVNAYKALVAGSDYAEVV